MRMFKVQKSTMFCFRFYCSKKPTSIWEEVANKKSDIVQEASVDSRDISEECSKFEERTMKQVLIEKEQEANLRSRLSKECRILFSGFPNKSSITKCGTIRLDKINADVPNWMTYDFDRFQSKEIDKYSTDTQIPAQPVNNKIDNSPLEIDIDNSSKGGVTAGGAGGASSGISLRPVREEPGKVVLGFIPEEWWRAFIPITGVSGFGTFSFTMGIFLLSKEYYVLEHYFYHGLSSFLLWLIGIKLVGPKLAKLLDKEVDLYEKAWNEGRVQQRKVLEDTIINELHCQLQMDGQHMLIAVKRENLQMQLEEEYRKRQIYAYKEVKKRLDYHVEVDHVRQRFQHKNLIEYVTKEVTKSITPDLQNKLIYYSIDQIIHDLAGSDKKNK